MIISALQFWSLIRQLARNTRILSICEFPFVIFTFEAQVTLLANFKGFLARFFIVIIVWPSSISNSKFIKFENIIEIWDLSKQYDQRLSLLCRRMFSHCSVVHSVGLIGPVSLNCFQFVGRSWFPWSHVKIINGILCNTRFSLDMNYFDTNPTKKLTEKYKKVLTQYIDWPCSKFGPYYITNNSVISILAKWICLFTFPLSMSVAWLAVRVADLWRRSCYIFTE